MLTLRHAHRWRVASLLILFIVLSAALMPAVWFWGDKVKVLSWFESVDKWLHGITFLILSLWFAGLYATKSYWRIALGLLVFGFFIEVCQFKISYRTSDWIDVAADAAGIMTGLAIGYGGAAEWCLRFEERLLRRRAGSSSD